MHENRIVIVGGGASGTILAAHLLRSGPPALTVAIVERRATIGAGIAYSTDEPGHLLNTRASGMSAFADDPDDFLRWMRATRHDEAPGCGGSLCFVPRSVYRDYLGALLDPWRGDEGRLSLIDGACVDLHPTDGGVAVDLGDGRTERGGVAVLATGHAEPCAEPGSRVVGPWCSSGELPVGTGEDVVILGTGLSMVDNVATLRRKGHRGRIVAVSRRGLLPMRHAPSRPFVLDPSAIPLGAAPAVSMRWLRRMIRRARDEGRDWRDVVDALRPHTQALWQAMPLAAKRSFLRHARTLWEVHRHRMAPAAADGLDEAMREGHLAVRAGRVLETRQEGGRVALRLRDRSTGAVEEIAADWVIDCMGILRDPASGSGRLVAKLLEAGRARLDPLGIGIDVAATGAVIDAAGQAAERVYAVGPVTRARFWEVTAIPDIRVQCEALARTLLDAAR